MTLKKGWSTQPIGSLCAKTKHALTGGPFGSNLTSKDYTDEGVPVIRGCNLPDDAPFSYQNLVFVSEKKAEVLHPNIALRGDLIFTQRGTLGQVGIVPKDSPYSRFIISQSQMKLTADADKADARYLYYYFRLPSTVERIHALAISSGVPHINLNILRKFQVITPPVLVQRQIANILSAYDELIENNKRRIALLEKMAEEIYCEWFVRFRFPGYENTKIIKNTPRDWERVRVERAFDFTGGGTPSKEIAKYWTDGEINWFTPSDITSADGVFLEQSGEQCTEEGIQNSSARIFPAYSVMLTSRATIGAVGINLTPACTNQGFITCIPNTRYPLPYLYHWVKLAKPHFELLAGGATFAELTKGTFKRIEILTPPDSIMNAFTAIEMPLLKAIELYIRANRKLIQTRDSLLPRLISGKLSVDHLDLQFPPSMQEELKPETSAATHA